MYKVNEDLTDADVAFPANALDYMPKRSEIPEYPERRAMESLVERWFHFGLKGVQFKAKEGVPGSAAWRQVRCIMGSYAPKHEHKIEAVAFLLNEWFEVIKTPQAEETTT